MYRELTKRYSRTNVVLHSYFDRTGGRGQHVVPDIESETPRSDGSVTIMKDREHRERRQKWPAQCGLGFKPLEQW